MKYFACNTAIPLGVQVTTQWILPEFNSLLPNTTPNCQEEFNSAGGGGTPGTYTGSVIFTWTSGQVRTVPIPYTILP